MRLTRWHVGSLTLGAIGLLVLVFACFAFIGSPGYAYDFHAFDLAARRLAAGMPLYPVATAAQYNSGEYAGLYLYPPPFAVALIPLTALPPDAAALVWFLGRIVVLCLACASLPVRREVRAAVFGVAPLSFPVLYDLNLGNISILVFALSVVIWRWADRPIGAFALAAIIAVRFPFGIVLLRDMVLRRWRVIAWTLAAGLLIVGTTVPIVGFGGYIDYVTIIRGLGDISTGPNNLSLATTVLALGGSPQVGGMAVLAGILLMLLVVAFASRRLDPEASLVVALTSTLLFAPFFHPHYLVALLIPAAFLAERGQLWALLLPVAGWLPAEVLPIVAIVVSVAPFLAPRRDASKPQGQPATVGLKGTDWAPLA